MIYQYAYNISEITNIRDVCDLYDLISDERKEKIIKYHFDKDKLHSMFAEVILRYALWERYGLKDLVIQKNEYGKPYLVNNKDIYFNLSHSGDWVLCGVGNENLGIDVEQIDDIELSVAEEFFTKEESDYLFTLNENDRLIAFYKIWTLKESYIKNVGEGLSIPLNSFMFKNEDNNIKIYIQGKKDDNYSFLIRSLDEQHSMSLCVTGEIDNMINNNFTILTLEEIMRWKKLYHTNLTTL